MKHGKTLTGMIALAICLIFASAGMAAEVSQGKCIADYDETTKMLKIDEYDIHKDEANPYGRSTGNVLEFDLSEAKIGITPMAGDVVRISYTVSGESKKAIKVMNVSKQDLMKK